MQLHGGFLLVTLGVAQARIKRVADDIEIRTKAFDQIIQVQIAAVPHA
jgi:hypothetical protein